MKIKFILIIFLISLSSCSTKQVSDNNSSPSSRINNIESGANRVFKEID